MAERPAQQPRTPEAVRKMVLWVNPGGRQAAGTSHVSALPCEAKGVKGPGQGSDSQEEEHDLLGEHEP